MLIGIVGFIGSGKDTVGNFLIEDFDFKHDSFANPLKDAVSIIFGWDRIMLQGSTKEDREEREMVDEYWSEVCDMEITPRLVLQLFGTESVREVFGENVWSASLIKRWKQAGKPNTVVTDCRFMNEIRAISDNGGEVWLVKRGENPTWYGEYVKLMREENWYEIGNLREKGFFPHVSETDWIGYDNFNAIIQNNQTLGHLRNNVWNLISK